MKISVFVICVTAIISVNLFIYVTVPLKVLCKFHKETLVLECLF